MHDVLEEDAMPYVVCAKHIKARKVVQVELVVLGLSSAAAATAITRHRP